MNPKYIGPIMKKISEEMEKQANEQLKKYRLTLTQGKIILFLSDKPEKRATQKELEDFLQVSHPTTVSIVRSMEAKNMIETVRAGEDRRMKYVSLVWGNEEIYSEIRDNASELDRRLLDGFSDEEKAQFCAFLDRVYRNSVC
ncbi:MAG: MarR family transcriptional regulator [Clostridiales bacterium]|nr:MarR family transcriptional regulator [Clostridiales bacterium]MDD7034715.1 MarR family transcriptional regulator [Bacillota bacterium]MDY2919657.1 MarR family transcriptional regulator [Lentihominibacter sp.]